ncbi:hypothetical protein VKS41_001393 [Umbelopsis sp. WA50703]
MKIHTIATILGLAAAASAEVFLHETFSDGAAWEERWTPSKHKDDLGVMKLSSGKFYADENKSAGLQTSEDYRFYAISAPVTPFSNKDKDLVVQYTVKNEQNIDCGGGYLKLFKELDPVNFTGDSEYNIMFGPDICGSKSMVHAILNYKGTNHNLKKTVSAPNDILTHTYTLVVKPDQTYQVLVDGEEKAAGSLLEDWDFLPPKKIQDPEAKKPADWVDEAEIDDPTDVKPEGYDDIPEFIPDPEAEKPEDWDDEMDGDWEAPSVANPEYQGPWSPKKIANPDYKGPWVHPEIDNPEYKVDNEIYAYDFGRVGFDLWQVKAGTIFDNILITDDVKEAEKARKEISDLAEKEKEAKEAFEEAERKVAEEKAAAEEEAKKAEEEAKEEETIADEIDEPVEDEHVKDEL